MESIASKKVLAAFMGFAMVLTAAPVLTSADSEDYNLFVSVDDTKVTLVSGNFSVAITRDWPRVIFKHDVDPFSPHFEISYPRMYVFNDSDHDGTFDVGEADLTVFLDSNHVDWNITAIDQGYTEELGEFVSFGMKSSLNAYVVGDNETLVTSAWANMTYWFFLAELPVLYESARGSYFVDGRTQLRMNLSLTLNGDVENSCVVMEQYLQGGGTTNTFHLYESAIDGATEVTEALATIDERLLEYNYSHGFRCTTNPMQKIQFAKEDGIVQAFYLWGSDVSMESNNGSSIRGVNSSYYTTGNGMMLHSVLPIDNETTLISHEYSTGIYESGFVGSFRDWLKEESTMAFVLIAVAVLVGAALLVWRKKQRKPCVDDSVDPEG